VADGHRTGEFDVTAAPPRMVPQQITRGWRV
jgi:hypothetical protein